MPSLLLLGKSRQLPLAMGSSPTLLPSLTIFSPGLRLLRPQQMILESRPELPVGELVLCVMQGGFKWLEVSKCTHGIGTFDMQQVIK